MANTWNKAGTTWGYNSWESDTVTISVTGVSATTSTGSLTAFNNEGWGRQEWGNSGWGVDYSVALSGLGLTSAIGEAGVQLLVPISSGVSASTALGSLTTEIAVPITAPSAMTASVGDTVEAPNAGWGRDAWGNEPWGDTEEPVITLTGVSATMSVGTVSA